MRYERALAKALPEAQHGQWWSFADANGSGYCQTDLVLSHGEALVVLEAKYSWVAEGHSQLEQLYLPVLREATGRHVAGVVVCRRLVAGMPSWARITGSLSDALALALEGHRPVLQWLGVPGVLSHVSGGAGRNAQVASLASLL